MYILSDMNNTKYNELKKNKSNILDK